MPQDNENQEVFGDQFGPQQGYQELPPMRVVADLMPTPAAAELLPEQYLAADIPPPVQAYIPVEKMLREDVVTNWNSRFAFEVALVLENSGDPIQEVLDRNRISKAKFTALAKNNAFNRALQSYRRSIQADGIQFKLKCKVLAEIWLNDLDTQVMQNPNASPASKVTLFQQILQVAELVPNNKLSSAEIASTAANNTNNFSVNIVVGSRGPKREEVTINP